MADEQAVRDLIEKMTEERDKLLAQVDALSDEDAGRAPVDAEGEAQWSVKEQCAHLAEMETAYRAWVARALAEDNPDVTRTRGEPVAIPIEDANKHSIGELTSQLRDQRSQTLQVIRNLTLDDYNRPATQRMFGTLTVIQWLRSFYRHDRMHQDQIAGRDPTYKPQFASGQEPDQRRTSAR
jgi:predicted HD phosphohydrolase